MQECDEQFRQMQAARGWRVDAQGWAIDKDGGISSWTIVTKDPNAKSHLQTMSENAEKIRKQNEERKQEEVRIEEKRQKDREEKEELQEKISETGKRQFDDKWRGVIVIAKEDEDVTANKADKKGMGVRGLNMDIKA